jgi:hypothetical protein
MDRQCPAAQAFVSLGKPWQQHEPKAGGISGGDGKAVAA